MASIQKRKTKGYTYWYIVQSRRVNGKPRPIVLEYLGTANKLLNRLREGKGKFKVKSYSHGAVAVFLKLAEKLNVVETINTYTNSKRSYIAKKPLRHNLTSGITLLLGSISRICNPTSKRGWWRWAKKTSCEYLLHMSLCKIDSQHFWDLMDCIPEESIEKIENEITRKVCKLYKIESEYLLYDTTNFYTYIDSQNTRCTIAQRGKNKQKRHDLRQVGLAMIVTQKDSLPLFHETYQGNMNDTKVFKKLLRKIKKRIIEIGFKVENHTIVFDRGNNSKKNLAKVEKLKFYYVGALTPYHHKDIIEEAEEKFSEVYINGKKIQVFQVKKTIWNTERTVVVFISEKLKKGQLCGIYQSLEKKKKNLRKIQQQLLNPKSKQKDIKKLDRKISKLLKGQFMAGLISYEIEKEKDGRLHLTWCTNKKKIEKLENKLGFRIVMTNRHEWSAEKIISAYQGQSDIEKAFRHIKNPQHLGVKPEFHWTDQKIKVHQFMCVLGYQLSILIYREVKNKINFTGSLEKMLEILNNIRLSTLIEEEKKKGSNKKNKRKGKMKVHYQIEEMEVEEEEIAKALEINKLHIKHPKITGVGVYN